MMTLDPKILSIAEAARQRMLERQHELERARADLNHEIRRLHAAGGSMREIADKLAISHQRVHQIVADADQAVDPLPRRPGDGVQRSRGGAFARFTEGARGVVAQAQEEATSQRAHAVEPEHLLLAIAASGVGVSARALAEAGAGHETLRAVLAQSDPSGQARDRRDHRIPFSAESKKVLELSLRESLDRGDDHVGSEHLLLTLLRDDRGRISRLLESIDVVPAAIREAIDTDCG
jgi:hypothetical protein